MNVVRRTTVTPPSTYAWGIAYAYPTLNDAIAAMEADREDLDAPEDSDDVSLAIFRRESGELLYSVGRGHGQNYGMDTDLAGAKAWADWWQDSYYTEIDDRNCAIVTPDDE